MGFGTSGSHEGFPYFVWRLSEIVNKNRNEHGNAVVLRFRLHRTAVWGSRL